MKKTKREINQTLSLLLNLLNLHKDFICYQQDKIKRFRLIIFTLIVFLVLIIAYFKSIGG